VSFLPLSRLFEGARSPGHPVALRLDGQEGETGARTFDAFAAAVGGVAERARSAGGRRWVLACDEAWDFAAGFFGLLLAGRTVVLPPNYLPQTLLDLEREADGVLWEARTAAAGPPPGTLVGGHLEFWTSGSTGEPKGVAKTLAQLDAEVALLERTFGRGLGTGPVIGTVPHHHIYGCLFRILWPLAAGRPFLCEPAGDPSRFHRALVQWPRAALVASPAHLSRLPHLVDLDAITSRPAAIFSSGGPLAAADALAWRRWVPAGVVEIYGSTETGGIGWRSQDAGPESTQWTPLDDVALAFEDGALVVDSFRAGGASRLEDAAEPGTGGRFRLLGRLDRTVKLEEKRVSLPELEKALESLNWVARAAVVLLEGGRPTLGAVIVLNPEAPRDRGQLVQALRGHLALRFDGLALPKRWRFPADLPYDERGKLTSRALAALFQPAPPRP
jgi:acyl-coenzyme A synthetase/AMP-(fatty) acid ligase